MMAMRRDLCFEVLAREIGDDIVVPTYSSAFEWLAIRPHPLNYVAVGAMGLASSHALGLALGCPDRRIVVLDGDGSLLMNLGTLVTIAEAAPRNLVHLVCQNGTYEANGGHPIPSADAVDFAAMARAAGYAAAERFDDLETFEARLGPFLATSGPIFATLRVEPGPRPPRADYGLIHGAAAREAFRTALRGGPAGALRSDAGS